MEIYETKKGRYKKGRLIGTGAFSRIYLVTNKETNRPYALSVFKKSITSDLEDRFVSGYSVLEHISHKNLVSVKGHGLYKGDHPFTVMEYLEDVVPIDQYVRERDRPPSLEEFVRIAVQICQGLVVLHNESIVHGDLHPSNILLGSDHTVKLVDFGLAHREASHPLTESRSDAGLTITSASVVGALGYIPPELVMASETTTAPGLLIGGRKADIYSVGCVLYYLLTGRAPMGLYQRPSRIRRGIPRKLDKIIERCTAYDPEERYPSVDQLESDLRSLLVTAHPGDFQKSFVEYALAVAMLALNVSWLVSGSTQTGVICSVLFGILFGLGLYWLYRFAER